MDIRIRVGFLLHSHYLSKLYLARSGDIYSNLTAVNYHNTCTDLLEKYDMFSRKTLHDLNFDNKNIPLPLWKGAGTNYESCLIS
jgi:hypothetical protein